MRKKIEYYLDTYDENRKDFIKCILEKENRTGHIESIKIPSTISNDLYIDIGYFPALKEKKRLLILSSGLHGIESFVGSPLQRYFTENFNMSSVNTGFLLIHSMNPYGFKYLRRFTENNVDLNRNFDVEESIFKIKNDAYNELNNFLNPKKPLNYSLFSDINFVSGIFKSILTYGIGSLRQFIPQGQYENEKGIFYGGNKFEINVVEIKKYLKKVIPDYDNILAIDLHTGVGQRYKMHLIELPNLSGLLNRKMMKKIFAGFKLEGCDSSFHRETGSYLECIYKMLKKDQLFLPILIDFGTFNSETFFGALKSLRISIEENQFYYYGYKNLTDKNSIQKKYKEMFFPEEYKWRLNAIELFEHFINITVKGFEEHCI
jgi:hypothetical protein